MTAKAMPTSMLVVAMEAAESTAAEEVVVVDLAAARGR